MEAKKSKRADLQLKQPLFYQLGLIVTLSIVLLAFEFRQFDAPLLVIGPPINPNRIDETIINTVRDQPLPPPKPRIPQTRIEIVTNDLDIPDLDLPFFHDRLPDLKPWQPPLPTREKGVHDPFDPVRIPDVFAEFKGGEEALFRWLSENLEYPRPELQAGIQGVVYVQFVVEKDGAISRVSVARGDFGGGLEAAALETVKRMPAWNPGKQRNRPVPTWFVLPIQFTIK